MLKKRVITALLLVSIFLVTLFFTPWYFFAAILGAFLIAGAWEWANLSGVDNKGFRIVYALVLAAIAGGLGMFLEWSLDVASVKNLLIVSATWWAVSFLWVQGFPSSAIIWGSSPVRLLMGAFVLIPAWLSCLFLLNKPSGAWLVLFVVFLVAAADIGAYFAGRRFGKNKLAPNVSPGKSWEGVWGGACFALFIAGLFNLYLDGPSWLSLLVLVFPTVFASVLGDLLESMVKRHRGIKDSSNLLPGHGGVLDRVDGLVAALPVFSLAIIMTQWGI